MNQKVKDYLDEFRKCEHPNWHKSSTANELAQQDLPQIKEVLLSIMEEKDFVIYDYAISKFILATHFGRYDVENKNERPPFLSALSKFNSYTDFYTNGGYIVEPWKEHIERKRDLLKALIEEDALEKFETDPRFKDLGRKYMELREKLIKAGVIPEVIF